MVPTYRRPDQLLLCLGGLLKQFRQPDQVVVVTRESDVSTKTMLAQLPPAYNGLNVVIVKVVRNGVVAAMQSGLDAVTGDVVALTDDDAIAHPDWLQRIEAWMAKSDVWGVGGRDWIPSKAEYTGDSGDIVGRVLYYGRVIGNHHKGVGSARRVDVLKGVNCCYRSEALRALGFDATLWGRGAQVHWELSLGLSLAKRGGVLIYDPGVAVDHRPGQRWDDDRRTAPSFWSMVDSSHNETLILLRHLSLPRKFAFLVWAGAIGTQASPGFLVTIVGSLTDPQFLLRGVASIFGRSCGLLHWVALKAQK